MASVGNLAARDRSNLKGLDGRHDYRVAVEGREFDLECLAVVVGMNHSSDIAGHQACVGDGPVSTIRSCSRIIARYAGTST